MDDSDFRNLLHNPFCVPKEFLGNVCSSIKGIRVFYDLVKIRSSTRILERRVGDGEWERLGPSGHLDPYQYGRNQKAFKGILKELGKYYKVGQVDNEQGEELEVDLSDEEKLTIGKAGAVQNKKSEDQAGLDADFIRTDSKRKGKSLYREVAYSGEFNNHMCPDTKYRFRYDYLCIRQPTRELLNQVHRIILAPGGEFVTNYIEVAVDYSFNADTQDTAAHFADTLQSFFLGYMMKSWSRAKELRDVEGTTYFEDRTKNTNIVLYSDRKSKLSKSKFQVTHLEFRLKRSTLESRLRPGGDNKEEGISLEDLTEVDLRKFVEKWLDLRVLNQNFLIDYFSETNRGNCRQRNKKARIALSALGRVDIH